MNDSKSNATGAGVSAVAAVVPPGLLGSRRLADGRILIPPPTDAARRDGTQRLRCSMGRCSRRGSLKAAFPWCYQDSPDRPKRSSRALTAPARQLLLLNNTMKIIRSAGWAFSVAV